MNRDSEVLARIDVTIWFYNYTKLHLYGTALVRNCTYRCKDLIKKASDSEWLHVIPGDVKLSSSGASKAT